MAVLVSVVSALNTETSSSSNNSGWSANSDSGACFVESTAVSEANTESADASSDCVDISKSNFRSDGRATPPGMVIWVGVYLAFVVPSPISP